MDGAFFDKLAWAEAVLTMNRSQMQGLLIRVYLGLDFFHHFAEKSGLLGSAAHDRLLQSFNKLTVYPRELLALAALCEFGAFVGFTFGLFTRVAAAGTALYIVIATLMGGHQFRGFTWSNPGGGWEFPALWTFVCLTFVLTGGGPVSVDRWLSARVRRFRGRG